jgi:hypothetical protein
LGQRSLSEVRKRVRQVEREAKEAKAETPEVSAVSPTELAGQQGLFA